MRVFTYQALTALIAIAFSSVAYADLQPPAPSNKDLTAQSIVKDLSFKALCLSGYVKRMDGTGDAWKKYPIPFDACLKHFRPGDLTDFQTVREIVVDFEKWIWVLNEYTGMEKALTKLAADFSYQDGVASSSFSRILSDRTVSWNGVPSQPLAQHLINIVDGKSTGFDQDNLPVMDYGAFFISFLYQYRKDFSGLMSYPTYWATKCPAFTTATSRLEEDRALAACTSANPKNTNDAQTSHDRNTTSFVMELLAKTLQLPNAREYFLRYSDPSNRRQIHEMVSDAYKFINNSCSPYNPNAIQDYTNIFLLSISAEFALGKFFDSLGDPIQVDRSTVARQNVALGGVCPLPEFYKNNSTDLSKEAHFLFDLWYERTSRNGISEVMAPNYYPVDLSALELLFRSFRDPAMRAKVRKTQSLLYAHLLLGWTPEYRSFNSALGRTYDFNTNGGFANSGLDSIRNYLANYFGISKTTSPNSDNLWVRATQAPGSAYAPFTVSPEIAFGYSDQQDLLTELGSTMKRTNRSVQIQYGPSANQNIKTFIGEEISLSSLGQSRGHEDVPVSINVKEMNLVQEDQENDYTGAYFLMDLSNDPLMTDDREKLRRYFGKIKPSHLIPDIHRAQYRNLLSMIASVSSNPSQMADFAAAGGCQNLVRPTIDDCRYLNGLFAHFVIPIRDEHMNVPAGAFSGNFNIYENGQALDAARVKSLFTGESIAFDDSKVLHFAFSKAAIGLNILGVKNVFGNSSHVSSIRLLQHPTLGCIPLTGTDCDTEKHSKLSFVVVTIRLGQQDNLFSQPDPVDGRRYLKSDIKRPTIGYILNTIRLDPSVPQGALIQANNAYLTQELAPELVFTHDSANTTTNLKYKFNDRNLSIQQTASQADFTIVEEASSKNPSECWRSNRGILCSDIRNDEQESRDLSPYFRSK